MKIHELKILPQYFEKVLDGSKTFELRKDDRGFEVGDILILKEFKEGFIDNTKGDPVEIEKRGYTGRTIVKRISYIYKGCSNGLGLRSGFVILALKDGSEADVKDILKGMILNENIVLNSTSERIILDKDKAFKRFFRLWNKQNNINI